jgi:hypothetical protein
MTVVRRPSHIHSSNRTYWLVELALMSFLLRRMIVLVPEMEKLVIWQSTTGLGDVDKSDIVL